VSRHGKTPRRTGRKPSWAGAHPIGDCPDCGKRCFTSRREAKRAADAAEQRGVVVTRVYRCGQWWHWTSQSAAKATAWRDWMAS
jgi:hypothetical protein